MTEDIAAVPLVSIGVPCFNRPEGLDRLLGSLTAQTFRDIEILVSDNCSPDSNVQRVAQRYAKCDPRVKVFRQPTNLGLIANHQFLRDRARGEYFMFAHDDDELPTNYIEACLSHFNDAPDVVLVGPSCDRYLEGKYWYAYDNYSSIGLSTYHRLRLFIWYSLHYHWRFEQYFSGLCLLTAAPRYVFSKNAALATHYLLVLSEQGTLASAPEVKIIKHTTQEILDSYRERLILSHHTVFRYFSLNMRNYILIAGQMLTVVCKSERLTVIEKTKLSGYCIALLVAHPLRREFGERIIPKILHLGGGPLRQLRRLVSRSS
jgi:glycosyltransferase involved in cell wall biosynthesis